MHWKTLQYMTKSQTFMKILLLDIDHQTLIDANSDEKYVNEKYDAIIKFKACVEEKDKNINHGEIIKMIQLVLYQERKKKKKLFIRFELL